MVTRRSYPTHWIAGLRKAVRLIGAVRGRPLRVEVSGESMIPAFRPGERLLVAPVGRVAAGQVVAVRDPRRPDRILVKRVRAVLPEGIDVRGDHPASSTDSRHFGPVAGAAVVGRVLYRYHPPGRAGWVEE